MANVADCGLKISVFMLFMFAFRIMLLGKA